MFALLIEPYAMTQVSILLQPHWTAVPNFVPAISACFGGTPGSHSRNPKVPRNPGSHGMDGTVTS